MQHNSLSFSSAPQTVDGEGYDFCDEKIYKKLELLFVLNLRVPVPGAVPAAAAAAASPLRPVVVM